MTVSVSMREMLEAGLHFGHLTRFRDPSMIPYIYGIQNGVHIINLEHTVSLFREALSFVHKIAARGVEYSLWVPSVRPNRPSLPTPNNVACLMSIIVGWVGN